MCSVKHTIEDKRLVWYYMHVYHDKPINEKLLEDRHKGWEALLLVCNVCTKVCMFDMHASEFLYLFIEWMAL